MNSRHTRFLLLPALLVLIGCSSGSDDPPTEPTAPDSPEEFTYRGWEYFEGSHFDYALLDFNSALELSPNYGEALAGKAWCDLSTTANIFDVNGASLSFEMALNAGEDESYVVAGLAAVRLAQGGDHLESAVQHANTVLSTNSAFYFTHRPSFNILDMRLILAFAAAAEGDFPEALVQADFVEDSGIDANDSATWTVAGTSYTNFNAAVLAHLQELSEQFAG
jgi:tetratricopeptide (TPR) repeat protein